jgi:hypothetical protein
LPLKTSYSLNRPFQRAKIAQFCPFQRAKLQKSIQTTDKQQLKTRCFFGGKRKRPWFDKSNGSSSGNIIGMTYFRGQFTKKYGRTRW